MLDKLYKNNPLGVLLICASIISSSAVMALELKTVIKTQERMQKGFDGLNERFDVLSVQVAGIQAVGEYKESIGIK